MRPHRTIWLDEDKTIRLSNPEDAPAFMELWGEYLNQQWEDGGELVPTSTTLSSFASLFTLYTTGHKPMGPGVRGRDGVAVFGADENAVLLWGTTGGAAPFDFRWGRTANGWGTYVRSRHRGKGWSARMRAAASKYMREELGFDAVIGTAHNENPVGLETGLRAGFEIYAQTGVLRLKE